MPLQTACTSCSAKIKVKDELIGKAIKCPKCSKVFKVAAQGEANGTAVQSGTPDAKKGVTTGAASQPANKPPTPAWDDGEDDDEKASPWNKKTKGDEDNEDDAPKAKTKAPSKKRAAVDDDDDDDAGDRDEDAPFKELLEQTLASEDTKKQIKADLGLRETGIWAGQPDAKIMTIRGLVPAFGGAFAITILCIILGVGLGSMMEGNGRLLGLAAGALWLIAAPVVGGGIVFMARRKALGTAYVITNKRCIVYTAGWFGGVSPESFYPDLLQHMRRMQSWIFGSDSGDIVFRSVTTITTTHHARGGASTSVQTTYFGFLGIRNLDETERIIRQSLLTDNDDDEDDDDDRRSRKKKKKRRRRNDDDD